MKTSIGYLEMSNETSSPSDLNSDRCGIAFINSVLYFWDGTSWTAVSGGSGSSSFDPIYDADKLLLMDGGQLEFRMTTEATGLYLNKTDVASGSVLKIANSGTGKDLEGPAWSLISTGAVGVLELTSGGTINASGGALTIGLAGTTTSFAGAATVAQAFTITSGAFTHSAGQTTLIDTSNTGASLLVTNNTATTYGAGPVASAGVAVIRSTSLTTGTLLKLQLTEGTLNGGYYLDCYDVTGSAVVFKVGEDGATTIAGAGAANALTLTAGDVLISDGSITMTDADNAATLAITNNTLTTASLATITANGLTTGAGLVIGHTTAVIAAGGSLARISSTSIDTSTTTGCLLDLSSTASTAGTQVVGTFSGLTSGIGVSIVTAALTTGTALKISAVEATLTTGKYIDCYDGAASDFSVGKYGATVIAGNAATTVLTLTAGNEVITAGNLVFTAGTVIYTPQAIVNANTAISITHGVTSIANNAPSTHALADGVVGQRKTIICTVYAGDAVITPSNLANGTTITLNAVNDACDLVFLGTEWFVINLTGTAALA